MKTSVHIPRAIAQRIIATCKALGIGRSSAIKIGLRHIDATYDLVAAGTLANAATGGDAVIFALSLGAGERKLLDTLAARLGVGGNVVVALAIDKFCRAYGPGGKGKE